ncbi:hypothetical protein A3E46_02905 [Candidatus Woesebacteria bacterium RIFCSPHIGHO2_12_FULL_46_16]|uniref:Uncharacterized protein n=1 Tax=Candidatus Woesebacteria bacterium RIFCSPHIGHO2_12_FULL_46_16 TaxID=1802513 RepID=A0A1F8AWF9_9BACT|nr:MAG: hypothetical protein A3E46_02905 [Candidatus Woesebacteria bacterium RIFCSPHIGHO2_12_FULL_46_16]
MKKTKTPSLVTITILTTITVIFWVFFTVYRVFINEPAPNIPAEVLEPLTPNLDKDTIDKIEARLFFSEGEIGATQFATASPSASPTPEATATPTSSPSASPTPTATGSASPLP